MLFKRFWKDQVSGVSNNPIVISITKYENATMEFLPISFVNVRLIWSIFKLMKDLYEITQVQYLHFKIGTNL